MSRSIPIKALPRAGADGSRAESVRRVVYDRALELFDGKGFRATSMNDIAEACGVSKPAIYHYYRNKSHLLETLYEDVTAEFFMTQETLAHSQEDVTDRLRRFVELQVLYNIENRRFLTIFWRERHEFDAASRKSLASRERAFENWIQHIIEDGQRSGEFRVENPKVAMLAILGLLSTVHRWAVHSGRTPQEIASELSGMVIDGVAKAPKPEKVHKRPKTTGENTSEKDVSMEGTQSDIDAGGEARPRHRRR